MHGQQGAETHQKHGSSLNWPDQSPEDRAYLSQPFTVIRAFLLPPQAGGHEPETHIDKFWLRGMREEKR